MHSSPTAPLPPVFRAATETVAPRALGFGDADWARAEAIIQGALAVRPAAVQRQLRLFLKVLQLLPIARYLKPFTALSSAQRLAVLTRLERSPLLLLRRGVWGVRTLGFMAVYAQPDVQAAVGYRGDPRGWEVRPGAGTAATAGWKGAADDAGRTASHG